jgi:hypothetical protein
VLIDADGEQAEATGVGVEGAEERGDLADAVDDMGADRHVGDRGVGGGPGRADDGDVAAPAAAIRSPRWRRIAGEGSTATTSRASAASGMA